VRAGDPQAVNVWAGSGFPLAVVKITKTLGGLRNMPEREVRQALATYVDEDGATRYALEGETVTVHPDHVKQFDEPNGGVDASTPDAAPKRRARQPKT